MLTVGVILGFLALLFLAKKASGGINTVSETKTFTLNDLIEYHAKQFGLQSALVKAIIKQESNFDINAKNPSDPSYGLMQVMPIAAQDAGIIKDYKNVTQADIDKLMLPTNNIYAGCYTLSRLTKKYTTDVAVEMYNVGERGYNELNRRNSMYRINVMNYYRYYMENK